MQLHCEFLNISRTYFQYHGITSMRKREKDTIHKKEKAASGMKKRDI